MEVLSILGVDDLPFLVQTISSSVSENCLPFGILGLRDIQDSSSCVDEELSLVSEDLPPSAGGTSDLQGLSSTIVLDMERLSILFAQDCSCLVVEVPDLVLTAGAD